MFLEVMAGIFYANVLEYCIHRFLFHGLGKKQNSFFAFHLRDHHLVSRRNGFIDIRFSKNEVIGMPLLVLLHSPLLLFSAPFFCAVSVYAILFLVLHNCQHRFPEFTKKYFWWHWNHHMRNQNKSWAVVIPITDILTGTLEKNEKNV